MKEGIKFGMGCTIGVAIGGLMLAVINRALENTAANNEKGGEEES